MPLTSLGSNFAKPTPLQDEPCRARKL